MPSEPANQAAAGVISDIFAEEDEGSATAEAVMPDPTQPEDLIPNEATSDPEVEQPQDELELPQINWDIPEELKDELEAPDFDEEEESEWESEGGRVEEAPEDEYEDPERAKLRKQLAKAKKQLAWAEEQKAKASQKNWAAEAQKYFQFSNPNIIQAKSRRAFLKEAQRQHEAVAKVAKPVFDQLEAQKEKLREQVRAEERARAEQMWGAPTAGPAAAHQPEDTQTMQRQRLAQGRSFTEVVRAKIKGGDYKL